jgi:hypothetical protein
LDTKRKARVVFAPITKSAQHSKKKKKKKKKKKTKKEKMMMMMMKKKKKKKRKTERQKNSALTSDAVPDAISGEKMMEEQETRQDGKRQS